MKSLSIPIRFSATCSVLAFSWMAVAHGSFTWTGGGDEPFLWNAADNWSGSFEPSMPVYWTAAPPSDSYPSQSWASFVADPGNFVTFTLSDFGPNPHDAGFTTLAEYQDAYNTHFSSLPAPSIYGGGSLFGPDPNDGFADLAEYRAAFTESTYNTNYTAAQGTVNTNIGNLISPPVTFNSAGSTVVNFSSNVRLSSLSFTPDGGGDLRTVQLNLAGNTLTGNFGPTSLGEQTVVFDGGVYNMTNVFRVGSGNAERDTLVRLQNGVVVNMANSLHYLGDSGSFAMEVVGGSELINPNAMLIGRNSGTVSTLTVSGVGSRVENLNNGNGTGNNRIGNAGGSGELIVENGGYFLGGRRIKVGAGADGVLIVRGSGVDEFDNIVYSTVATTGNASGLFLRGDRDGSSATGTAYALFKDGGQGIFGQALAVWDGGILEIDRGFVHVTAGNQAAARTFDEGGEIIIWLHSGEYERVIHVNGSLTINDALLTIKLGDGFMAGMGEEFFLIQRPATFSGTFDGLAEGSTFTVDGYTFEIGYAMGDSSNMIGLTVIPEPRLAGLAVAILAALFVSSRRRQQRC